MSAESFKAYLGRVQTAVKQKSDGIQIAALKSLEAEHKTRIFNDGQATTGQPIGKYSAGYAAKRKAAGRQTSYVDLEFFGNLRKNIQVGKSQGRNVYGFLNTLQRKIAEENQRRFGKRIFNITAKEAKDVSSRVALGLRKAIANV